MATCSPVSLLDSGRAFAALSARDLDVVICQLLCEVSAAPPGGSQQIFSVGSVVDPGSTGAPVNPPPSAGIPNLYYNSDSQFWYWDVAGTDWVAFIQ